MRQKPIYSPFLFLFQITPHPLLTSPPACQVAEKPRKRAGYESWQRFKDALIVDNLKPKSLGVAWGLQESGESLIDFVLQKGEMRHIKFDF